MFKKFKRLLPKRFRKEQVRIPVVRLQGAIMAGGSAFRPALNIHSIGRQIDRAFRDKSAPAVAFLINSPGGSPVQARAIYSRIRQLAEEKDKRVLVYVEDVAASGGYLIALAGDEIIADPTSIVGSIGVISGGFGFPELLKKIGVERRVYTSGANKSVLDPFSPEKQGDIDHLKGLQAEVHTVFINMVKARRGAKLVENDDLFSGLFWSGERGLALGLVDGLGDLWSDLKRRYGPDVEIDMVETPRGFFSRFMPSARLPGIQAEAIGGGLARGLADTAEEKAMWSRYGL